MNHIAKCILQSEVPKHVHPTMFIKNNLYSIFERIDEWDIIEGRFMNSLGGSEYKVQSIKRDIWKQHLKVIESHE